MQLAPRSSESRSKIPTAVPFVQNNLTEHTSRARVRRRAAPGRRPWRSLRPGIAQIDGAQPVPEVLAPAPLGPAGRRALVPRYAVSAQDRTRALARRLADAGQVARRPVRPAQPPGSLGGHPDRAGRPRAPPTRRHAPARISSWLTGGRRSRGMHDGWPWGPSRRSWRLGAVLPRRNHPGSREVPLGPRPRDKFHSLSSGHIV